MASLLSWKGFRFVTGLLTITIACAVVMVAGVLGQLGRSTLPESYPDTTPTTSSTGAGQNDDGATPTSFWDSVLAADVLKGQIDRAAAAEDCEELDRLSALHAHGVPVSTQVEDTDAVTRDVLGYIAAEQVTAGCT